MPALPREFYERDTTQVARELIGKRLVRRSRNGTTSGRIVEVEAYLSAGDSACHAARGPTRSNAAMFGPAGRAYVYPIHSRWCLNAVTERRGVAAAVLIRAIEPLEGLELMRQRRGCSRPADLARGPGRLCQALAIDRRQDHWDLTRGCRLWIEELPEGLAADWELGTSARIGVTSAVDLPLRYFIRHSPYVSGPRRLHDPAGRQHRPSSEQKERNR